MLFPEYIHSILNDIFNEAGGSWLVVTGPFYDKRGSSCKVIAKLSLP